MAATPETVRKLSAKGHSVRVQRGAGLGASATDEAYAAAVESLDSGRALDALNKLIALQ